MRHAAKTDLKPFMVNHISLIKKEINKNKTPVLPQSVSNNVDMEIRLTNRNPMSG